MHLGSCTLLVSYLLGITLNAWASPTPTSEGSSGDSGCIPWHLLATNVQENREDLAKRSIAHVSVRRFLQFLESKPPIMTETPMFYYGKMKRVNALQALRWAEKDGNLAGEKSSVWDALKAAEIRPDEYRLWSLKEEWQIACGAYAKHAKPKSKTALFFYGEAGLSSSHYSIWVSTEWPALLANNDVEEVQTFLMCDDGKSYTPMGEIKKSQRGSPVKLNPLATHPRPRDKHYEGFDYFGM